MRLSDFDFDLPPEAIAQHPVKPRDAAKLLHVTAERLGDHIVRDLPQLLQPGDLLVANDTRVIPAQLSARRGEARIGITLDRPLPDGSWQALARNAKRLRDGDRLDFDGAALSAIVAERRADGSVALRFDREGDDFVAALEAAGALALPPYIERPEGPTVEDATDYQTVFADPKGAVAAPTAGLHFTPELLAALESRGVKRATVTLHVGVGTFLPVRVEDVSQHRMHAERGIVTAKTADLVNATRAAGGRIVCVGTTSLRLLESAASEDGLLRVFAGDTDIFITPGYQFRIVDRLMTNFHLPRSTLFMLVSAFMGMERMRSAYDHAIRHGYRFFSYGDASLLERAS
ncbi:MAG TPA: tRNA preQ1(34) S-adenosylmethionine ribosyltransferase-isomerase QueA [Acidisoma sp.]|uniref:tRNA preQ1(34) S-adenosylmethionine ribosyltransferase-isomerase QueA n=1 Tax=Acidisoma sp. TaxID=1872115 RepID=UPI002CCC6BC3|nr:tRNA preQ1(34) S-adenosylmethionine ribosyltransferase-isomerase QueA [Acidisoma sp.]HTI01734.1 tRNA preQ1(34) S-adenosylmethionine ribosyltransferase-isomerase QueA [Acidisoma sp.]